MKKLAMIAGLIGLLFTGCNYSVKSSVFKKIDMERKFSAGGYEGYLVESKAYPEHGVVCATYDLDRNGKIDLGANFEIVKANTGKNTEYITKKKATLVFINPDEDLIVDYSYSDRDGDGILETKEKEIDKVNV